MHANDQHLFVIRTVEDADLAALRHDFVRAPEVAVVEFLSARGLEGMNVAALRIEAGHDVFYDAVFSSGIHRLQDDEQRPAILRVKLFLHAAQQLHAVVEQLGGAFLVVEFAGIGWIEILQTKLFLSGNAIGFGEFCGSFCQFVVFHGGGVEV